MSKDPDKEQTSQLELLRLSDEVRPMLPQILFPNFCSTTMPSTSLSDCLIEVACRDLISIPTALTSLHKEQIRQTVHHKADNKKGACHLALQRQHKLMSLYVHAFILQQGSTFVDEHSILRTANTAVHVLLQKKRQQTDRMLAFKRVVLRAYIKHS